MMKHRLQMCDEETFFSFAGGRIDTRLQTTAPLILTNRFTPTLKVSEFEMKYPSMLVEENKI